MAPPADILTAAPAEPFLAAPGEFCADRSQQPLRGLASQHLPRWTALRGLLYNLALGLFILVYINLLLWALCFLAGELVLLPGSAWLDHPGWVFGYAAGVGLAVPLMMQFATHLWWIILGLITRRFEPACEPQAGEALPRGSEPKLDALVERVARQVQAPVPDRVQLSPLAECFVYEERRFGLAPRRELILVVGFPHLAVLNQAELQVIIAHELAHFREGDTRVGVFHYRFLEALRGAVEATETGFWQRPVRWFQRAAFHCFLRLMAPLRQAQELRADAVSAQGYGGNHAANTLLKEWLLAQQFEAELAQGDGDPLIYSRFRRHWKGLSAQGCDYLERRLTEDEAHETLSAYPTMRNRLAALRSYPDQPLPEAGMAAELLTDWQQWEARFIQRYGTMLSAEHETC